MTAKALELAIAKATALPEAAQERLGREMLERMDGLTELQAEVGVGLAELDSGQGEELDIESVIQDLRKQNAKG
jgi:hypothetical protein